MLKLVTDLPHENLRDTRDYQIDISELVNKLAEEKEAIADIEICADNRMRFCKDGTDFSISNLATATGITVTPITL